MYVGFRARNHPQQVRMKGAKETVDERITPSEIFGPLHREFAFTVDAAATERTHRLPRFWSPAEDGRRVSWQGERVWCNPPYSSIEPWVTKALKREAEVAVLLLPANRTEQPWWQKHLEPVRDRGCGVSTRFLSGRPRFRTPSNPGARWNSSCPFGLVAVIVERASNACIHPRGD